MHVLFRSRWSNNNTQLQTTVNTLTTQMESVLKENKTMKETILDLQSRSMRYDSILSGIPETTPDDPESHIKNFMRRHLKLQSDTADRITFHRVHRLGARTDRGPRPIVAKFEHYQQKELVKSKCLNDHFPREINGRRKMLWQHFKKHREQVKRASLVVDKLYIDGRLFQDCKTTPWLF